MRIISHKGKNFIYRIKIELLFISLATYNFLYIITHKNYFEKKDIKIALCTMGKNENLYVKEFIEYYIKIGIDHIFIYDDNEQNTEKISDALGNKYKNRITIYENIKLKLIANRRHLQIVIIII